MSFQIICIVDREANPEKRFAMSRDAVDEIGKQCLKYSGSINGTKMPISIKIMEVGDHPIDNLDSSRLKGLKRRSIFSKCIISAWIVDTSTGSVWCNAPFNGRGAGGRGFIEQMMKSPRASDEEMRPIAVAVQSDGRLYLTYGFLAALAFVFIGEQLYAVEPSSGLLSPSISTLLALGGLSYPLVVESGEWFRILSAALLHGGLIHLVLNAIALYMAGAVLERLVGRAWFFALFVIGAVSGSLMSLVVNPPNIVSVGASGAIMALLTAAYVCSFRLPVATQRSQIQINLLQVLIPSLLPLAISRTGQHIDFGAHVGGALSGVLVGFAMLKTWPITNPLPRLVGLAQAISIVGLAAIVFAVFPVAKGYNAYMLDTLLIPSKLLPKSQAEAKLQSSDLVARYPRDPRSRLWRASALLDSKDTAGAERELRAGLAEKQILKTKFNSEVELRLRTILAIVLLDKGQPMEAKTIAIQVCSTTSKTPMRELLMNHSLCD